MKKARTVPCLAVMAAGLLAGSAAAQDAPGRAVAGDGSFGFDRFGNRNFQLRSDIGDGIGYQKGYQTFGIFQPLMLEPDQSLFFVNPRGVVTYDGQFVGNLGGGFRWLNPENERILGIGGWFDHDIVGGNDYDQWGVSFESLGNLFDFRANAYIPLQQSSTTLQQNLTGSVFFVGNNIGLGRFSQYQTPFAGGDFEVGGAVIPGFSDAGIRGYVGGYYLQGDDTLPAPAYGAKARLEALITQDLQIGVGWSNDTYFDTNLTASVTWYLGTGEAPRWFQRMPQPTRLYQQMERNYRNMVLTHDITDFVLALRAGGTGGSGGPVGTPIFVVHVDNTSAGGGDGSVEHPFNQLPNTTGSNVDIILVERGNGTSSGMNGGIVLNDYQRLLGDGLRHNFTSLQGTYELPGFSPGAFPTITSLGGNAVTLASHNEVSAFNITNAGGAGITGNNVEDFNINNVNISDAATQGIFIANASGTGLINNVNVTDAGQNGVDINSTGTSVLDLTLRNNTVTGSGASGIDGVGLKVSSFDTAAVTVDSRFDDYSNNASDGVLLSSAGSSTLDSLLRDITAGANGANGVTVRGADQSIITADIQTSDISGNLQHGVQMRLTQDSTGSLSITDSTLLENTVDGVRLDLEDASIADLVLTGNTISGGTGAVGLTFFINGDTFLSPFAITNSSLVGGPDLLDFNLTLAGTMVFDTAGTASVPFAPVNPTQTTTGLVTVNGTVNPPGWVVADDSQSLDMSFNNFNPLKTFRWNIDIDPDPATDGTIFGNDLIGSTVSATYSNGQVLTGALVAVPGNPFASTFVATSSLLGGGDNVHVIGSGTSQLRSALIDNNSITQAGGHGIRMELSGSSSVGAGGVAISNNTIDGNGTSSVGDGISVLLSGSAQIDANRLNIETNTITNNSGNGVGLRAEDASLLNAVLRGNTITDNTLAGVSVSSAGVPLATVNVSILEQNEISNNGTGGVLFDMLKANTTAVISDAIISDNGGIGIAATATDGQFNLTVGGPLATDTVLLDNNIGAGIAFSLLDTAVGTTLIQNNIITNTTALAGSTIYTGQAIDLRLSDSGVPVTATAALLDSSILDNQLGADSTGANGNAGAGLVVFANNDTTIDNLLIDNNSVRNSGAQGMLFDRRNTATVDGVVVSNNLISDSTGNGVEINAQNANNDINDYRLETNDILDSGNVGVQLNIQADAQLRVDMDDNNITRSVSDGVRLSESINSQNDTRFITGTWTNNTISNNGGAGINDGLTNGVSGAAVFHLNIGTLDNGNLIQNNTSTGIILGSPGSGSITSNTISGNNGGRTVTTGVGGIDINNTSSATNLTNEWSISRNSIFSNGGDGIEILNNQPEDAGGNPGLKVTISDNAIQTNGGRGIDILNRISLGQFRSDLAVSIAGNQIRENNLEAVYLVNTASTSQDQTSPAGTNLAADGSVFSRPRTDFSFTGNIVTGNGNGSAFNTTGLIILVGTSDGGYGFTNPGGFFSSGRGGVGAEVTGNTFSNTGNDIYYQSFTSTADPSPTTGTWDATTFAVTGYQGDPLARLDLIQSGNTFDSTAVNNIGAFYNNAEATFKSRTVGPDPGPFTVDTRQRNAQRLGFRGTGINQLDPSTPGGVSDLFLYSGMGRSTFRIQTGFEATAGFILDDAVYNDPSDANGVSNGTLFNFMPYGWTQF